MTLERFDVHPTDNPNERGTPGSILRGRVLAAGATLLPKRSFILLAAAFVCLAAAGAQAETYFTQAVSPLGLPNLVRCTMDGEPQVLLLDTGASSLALDKKYLRKQMSVQGKGTYPNGEPFVVPIGTGPTIKIQSFELREPQCAFFDFPDDSRVLGVRSAGILGFDPSLVQAKLYFDFGQATFTAHSGDWLIDGAAQEVSLSRPDDTPMFTATLCGHETKLIVDTGSTLSVTLPKELFEALVKERAINPSGKSAQAQSAGGVSRFERGVFVKGELMGRSLAGTDVLAGTEHGSVRLAWLKNFNFEIAFAERILRYRPAKPL